MGFDTLGYLSRLCRIYQTVLMGRNRKIDLIPLQDGEDEASCA